MQLKSITTEKPSNSNLSKNLETYCRPLTGQQWMGSSDDAPSSARSSEDHQLGGECEQAVTATVQDDRGVPVSLDGDSPYEPSGCLPSPEAAYRLSGEQEAPQWQIEAGLSKGAKPASELAEKLPKTRCLSNRDTLSHLAS